MTNATTASGGQDLESIDQAKARATLAVRSQERVVTGEDAAYFTARVDGVSRAKAIGAKYYAGNELHSALGAFVVGAVNHEDVAQHQVGLGVVGIERDRLEQVLEGARDVLLLIEPDAEVVLALRSHHLFSRGSAAAAGEAEAQETGGGEESDDQARSARAERGAGRVGHKKWGGATTLAS